MKNQYEVRGEVTAIFIRRRDGIELEALIDTSDLQKVMEFPNTWYSQWSHETKSYYVKGNSKVVGGKRRHVLLHRLILDEPEGLVIDHINHETLDNTRKNLRICTHSENHQNKIGPRENTVTGIRNVYWHKRIQKYQARVQINKKTISLGYYTDKREAELAAIEGRKKYMPFSQENKKRAE